MVAQQQLKNKRVLLLGLGVSGQAAAHFLLRRGAKVVAADSNADLLGTNPVIADLRLKGLETVSDKLPIEMGSFDLVVVSPGIPVSHAYYQKAKAHQLEIIGEVELACREITQKCVAITGTNGKTTVTSLVAHVLNASGKKAKALGNIGLPLTAALDEEDTKETEIFVIELSSFQLETLSRPFVDAGVILNITPDHLDRYPTMQEYAMAKVRLKDNLKTSGKLFVEDRCWQDYKALFGNTPLFTYGYSSECYLSTDTHHVFAKGRSQFVLPVIYQNKRSHDVENLMAAYLLCHEMGVGPQDFLTALATFKKPSHRIEFVRTLDGVQYYDDSKGTNIDAVVRAVHALEGQIVLIAGGVDKGFPYTSWIEDFNGKVKAVCAIGQSAQKMQKDLASSIHVQLFDTLEKAVQHAASLARPGDNVLLSPGCSSFDMFKDYAHRGKEFQRIVNAL